jgi:hypothetical protein
MSDNSTRRHKNAANDGANAASARVSSLTVAESSDSWNQAEIRRGQGQMQLVTGNRGCLEVGALYP